MSLNFASAAVSPGLRSGCHVRASFRYAFLMASASASLETPSVA